MTNGQIEYDQAEVEVTSQDYITKGREVIICGRIDEKKMNSENGDYKISGKVSQYKKRFFLLPHSRSRPKG